MIKPTYNHRTYNNARALYTEVNWPKHLIDQAHDHQPSVTIVRHDDCRQIFQKFNLTPKILARAKPFKHGPYFVILPTAKKLLHAMKLRQL